MSSVLIKKLLEVKDRAGNDNQCAECGATDPEWASYTLGVFLCVQCCSVHRNIGTHISKVKGLKLDNWNPENVEAMDELGNRAAAEKYLKYVHACYPRPTENSPLVHREQWIRAKYERLEFLDPQRQTYLQDKKEGILWKKGRDDSKFLPRRFELDSRKNQLSYYVKEGAKLKASIRLDELNCCFVPAKMGNQNGMQMSYDDNSRTRNLFVYSESGKDIMDWYLIIRHSKLNRLRIGFPHLSDSELVGRLSRDFTLEGWLYKTGPNPRDAWRKRFFTLDGRKLLYSDDPLSAFAKGEIFISHLSADCSLEQGVPTGRSVSSNMYPFTLNVPGRTYPLAAETSEERENWMRHITAVICREMTAEDQAQKSIHFRSARRGT